MTISTLREAIHADAARPARSPSMAVARKIQKHIPSVQNSHI